ncbi:MAG TPA: hypothetical protein PK228_02990 [Saprospiraceae bacterium]|nr:hypothetical protein [Saprospiraceae bacterium]
MEDNNKKKLPRRVFLETGITGSVGVALGLATSSILTSGDKEAPEMIKMLTADGKLVEVEKRLVPEMCGKPMAVSNQELKEWMENGGK